MCLMSVDQSNLFTQKFSPQQLQLHLDLNLQLPQNTSKRHFANWPSWNKVWFFTFYIRNTDHVTISFAVVTDRQQSGLPNDVTPWISKAGTDAGSCRRARWRAPVIQAAGRLRLLDRWSSGALGCSRLRRSGVRAKFGMDMVLLGEPGATRSSKEGCTGPGRKRSRSKPPCRSVVGSRPWIDAAVQPG